MSGRASVSQTGRHELATTQRVSHRVLGVIAIALIAVLGVAIATQVRGASSGDSLDSARPADLLAVLDNLNRREAALRQEIADLQASLASLEKNGSDAALAEARDRLEALAIQVGTVPATGPGVSMRLTDPTRQVGPAVLLDAVQELRAAGAEAIQIAGDGVAPIRVGVDTWVGGAPGAIVVDATPLAPPYTLVAIGDPPTLAAAINIPGGVVDSVSRSGGNLTVQQSDQVGVTAVRDPQQHTYAQPGN